MLPIGNFADGGSPSAPGALQLSAKPAVDPTRMRMGLNASIKLQH